MSRAITSESDLLNLTTIRSILSELDNVNTELNNAKVILESAETYCGSSALSTDQGNGFESQIENICDDIESIIKRVNTYNANVLEYAKRQRQSQNWQLAQYQKEQEELAAASTTSGGSGTNVMTAR